MTSLDEKEKEKYRKKNITNQRQGNDMLQ